MPVDSYYYSESEWDRLGCGPLPDARNRNLQQSFSDGPVMVSTGVDSGDGNTRGDGRNPSKSK